MEPDPLEDLVLHAFRATVDFFRNLSDFDASLLAIIAVLTLASPPTRRAAFYLAGGGLAALSSSIALLNTYVLTKVSLWFLPPPGRATLAILEIVNFLTPIGTDASVQAQLIVDAVAHGMPLPSLVAAYGNPVALKIARTTDAAAYISDRVQLIMNEVKSASASPLALPSLPEVPPLLSKEIGTAMQLVDNLYALGLFLHSVHTERRTARDAGEGYVPTAALTAQATPALVSLIVANFALPIVLGTAQLVALTQKGEDDSLLPFYLEAIKALVQILGAQVSVITGFLQQRRNRLRAAAEMLGDLVVPQSGEQGAIRLDDDAEEAPTPAINVHSLRRSYRSHRSRRLAMPLAHWTMYSRAFRPELDELNGE